MHSRGSDGGGDGGQHLLRQPSEASSEATSEDLFTLGLDQLLPFSQCCLRVHKSHMHIRGMCGKCAHVRTRT